MNTKSYEYTNEEILLVWNKATIDPNYNPLEVRRDRCGAPIIFSQYGNRNSKYGWEIDHIIPVSRGGQHHINNVQPLQWENNVTKGDGMLVCKIRN